uniref:Large ribosomal subunit protein uL11m n=1 Tax=Syphacia muris TaxID=451379 RepID=A0A0N5AFQ5_9BILA
MATKVVRTKKKGAVKVIHNMLVRVTIGAQMASAAPPLGPQLGQRGINIPAFCKHFNGETSHIQPGVPLPTRITVNANRSYDLEICSPLTSWLIKRAAGIRRASEGKGEIAGKLSVKHVYEIAKAKSKDKMLVGVPLKEICEMVVKQCHSMGIEVVKQDLDPVEYKKFLEDRKVVVDAQLKALAEKKAAKALRTT